MKTQTKGIYAFYESIEFPRVLVVPKLSSSLPPAQRFDFLFIYNFFWPNSWGIPGF
jgi:hypothetical protein